MMCVRVYLLTIFATKLSNATLSQTETESATLAPPPPLTPIADEDINLRKMTFQSNKYFKYAVIIFCKSIDKRLFAGHHSHIPSWHELEQLPETGLSLMGSTFKRIRHVCLKVVQQYDDLIRFQDEDYLGRAFYFRALSWLGIVMIRYGEPNSRLDDELRDNIIEKRARNIAEEFAFDKSRFRDFTNLFRIFRYYTKLTTIETLSNWGIEEDQIIEYCLKLARSPSIDAAGNAKCTRIPPYEKFIDEASLGSILNIFEMSKERLLWYVYIGLRRMSLSKRDPEIRLPAEHAIRLDEIDLSKYQKKSVMYCKHLFLMFFRAVDVNIMDHRLQQLVQDEKYDTLREILWWPTQDEPYPLRYCTIKYMARFSLRLYVDAIKTPADLMENDAKNLYFRRLLKWLKYKLKLLLGTECNMLDKEIDKILEFKLKEPALTNWIPVYEMNSMLTVPPKINFFKQVLRLGVKEDEAILSLCHFVITGNPSRLKYEHLSTYRIFVKKFDKNKIDPSKLLQQLEQVLQPNNAPITAPNEESDIQQIQNRHQHQYQESTTIVHSIPPDNVHTVDHRSISDTHTNSEQAFEKKNSHVERSTDHQSNPDHTSEKNDSWITYTIEGMASIGKLILRSGRSIFRL